MNNPGKHYHFERLKRLRRSYCTLTKRNINVVSLLWGVCRIYSTNQNPSQKELGSPLQGMTMSYLKSKYNVDGISIVSVNGHDYIVGNYSSEQRYCVDNGMVITIDETADRDPYFKKYRKPRGKPKLTADQISLRALKQEAFIANWNSRHPGKKFTPKTHYVKPISETHHFLPKVKSYDVKSFGPDGKIKKHMFGIRKPVKPITKSWKAKTKKALSSLQTFFDPLPPHPYQAWFVSRMYPILRQQQIQVWCRFRYCYELDAGGNSIIRCYARWEFTTSSYYAIPSSGDPVTRLLGFDATGKTVNDFIKLKVADHLNYSDFTNTDSANESKLIGKLWEKASGSSFNLLTTIGEFGETWAMLVKSITTLLKVAIAFKKFDFVEVFRLLTIDNNRGSRPSLSPTDIARLSIYSVTDAWLAFRFGWQPLLHDIISLQEKLVFISTQSDVRKFRVRTSSISETKTNVPHQSVEGVSFDSVTRVTSYQLIGYLNGNLGFIDLFQLDSGASLAWELLPFSFVIDWFVQIGDRIANYEHSQKLHGTFVYTKTTYTTISGLSSKAQKQGNIYVKDDPAWPAAYKPLAMNGVFRPPTEAIPANVWTYSPYFVADAAYVPTTLGNELRPITAFAETTGQPGPSFTGGACPQATHTYLNIFDTSDSQFFESSREVERKILNDLSEFGQDLQFENKFASSFDLHSIDALSLLIQQVRSK